MKTRIAAATLATLLSLLAQAAETVPIESQSRAIMTIVLLAFADDGTFTTNKFFVEQSSMEACVAEAKTLETQAKARKIPNQVAVFWCTPLGAPPMR